MGIVKSVPHVVFASFTFKSVELKNDFVSMLRGPDGLCVTRAAPGCRFVECLAVNDEERTIVLRQEWDTPDDHVAYYRHRVESGMIEHLDTMMDDEVSISRLTKLDL